MKTTIESLGRMHSPAHPGEILKAMYLEPMGVSITKAADALGVSRKHVSAIVNGRAGDSRYGGSARGRIRNRAEDLDQPSGTVRPMGRKQANPT